MNRYERFRKLCVGAGWLYFLFMAYMLLSPCPPVPPPVELTLSFIHFLAFAVLGFIVGLARKKTSSFYWFGMLFVWCAGSEFLQRHTGRYYETIDIIQNTLGVAVGLALGYVAKSFLTKRLFGGEAKAEEKGND